MPIDRNVFNLPVTPQIQAIVDTIRAHYESQGKKNAAEMYPKLVRQWLQWGLSKGWGSPMAMPPDAIELFLAEKGAAFTTTGIMRNSLKAVLNIAPSLGIELPPQVLSAEKYKKRGSVRLADGTIQSDAPQAPIDPTEYQMPADMPDMNTPDIVDLSDSVPVAAPAVPAALPPAPLTAAQPVQPPIAPPALASVQAAILNGHPVRVANPNAKPPKAPAPSLTADEKAAKALLSNAPFFRISRVSDGSDPRIPPGMTTFVGVFPSKDLIMNGDIPDFLQRHVVPKTQIRPGTGEILFIVEELDSHRRATGRREEFPIAVPFGGVMSNPMFPFGPPTAAPEAAPAPAEPSRTEDMYLRKLEEKIATAEAREADLQKKLTESTNTATTMMLMAQMQREQDLRRDLEESRNERMRPMDPFGGLTPGMAGMGGIAPPPMNFPPMPEPAPKDDSMKELIKILAERAFQPPPPPPPQQDPMQMFMGMLAVMEKLRPQGPSAEVIALTAKMEAMTAKVEEKLSGSGTKTLKDQLADLVAMRQAMEVLGGGGDQPSTIEMLAQNADGILKGVAEVVQATRGQPAPQPQPVPMPVRRLPPPQYQQQGQQQIQQMRQQQVRPPEPPAPAPQPPKKVEPPAGALAALAIMEAADPENDQEIVSAFTQVLQELSSAVEPFPTTLRRLLNAFHQAEVKQDIYAIVKTMFFGLGKKVPHAVVSKVTEILHRHYTQLHAALFDGEERRLEDAEDETQPAPQVAAAAPTANGATDDGEDEVEEEEEDSDEDEDEDEDGEDDEDAALAS